MLSVVRLPAVGILVAALLATAGCSSDNDETGAGPRVSQLVLIPNNLTVEKGSALDVRVQAITADGTETFVDPADVTWTSSDETIATIADGVLEGLQKGAVEITAAYSGLTTTVPAGVTPAFVGIRVPPTTTDVARALSASLSAFALFDDNSSTDVSGEAVWSSAARGTATVAGNVVTGVAAGSTTVSADFRGNRATANVTVSPRLATALTVTGESAIVNGMSTSLTAEATFDDATTLDVTGDATWSTSDDTIAAVDGGVVTSVAPGTATITAEFQQGSGATPLAGPFTATFDVTVKPADVVLESLAIAIADPAIPINTETELTAVATFSDASTLDVTDVASFSLRNNPTSDADFHAVLVGSTVSTSAIPGIPLESYKPGTVDARASLTVKGTNKTATVTFTVNDSARQSVAVTASPGTTIAVGGAAAISVTETFVNGFTFDLTPRATLIVSNPAVLAVDDTTAEVVGLTSGTADVSAWVNGEDVGSVSITVQ